MRVQKRVRVLQIGAGMLSMLIVLGVSIVSCKREKNNEGPDLNDIYGAFSLLEEFKADRTNVDFSAGETVQFTARFSAISDWIITISSTNTGATKTINGRSNILDVSNAVWDGTTTKFPSFSTGPCNVELFLKNDTSQGPDGSTYDILVTVDGIRTPTGSVVADFEAPLNPKWTVFKQAGGDMSFVRVDTGIVPQGKFYYDMAGGVDFSYLIGYIDFPATAYGASGFDLGNSASSSYFNVLLNTPKGITNSIVLFQFKEDEDGNGTFNENNEDMYSLELKGLDEGWQVVSIKYEDLKSLKNGAPSTPKGNGVYNPDKLHTLSCLFLADPKTGYSRTLMDYIIFTKDEALKL